MLICVKKAGNEMDYKRVLKPTIEDFKAIIGANVLSTREINENITCIYDYNNLDTDNEYNFILLEEQGTDYELVEAVKGTVVFVRTDSEGEFTDLEEEDVSYLFVNYMKNTCSEVNTKKRYDTLEIFA